jgi:Cd2+/Zn2+-exporting ATPase
MGIITDLSDLGFTEYEGKIYLALLKESPANGYQLSKRTGVPRSMVYEALGRLHARGAVLKSCDKKTTSYRPLPPEQLLERYERQQNELIHNLRGSLQDIYDSKTEDLLWTISGQEPSFSYASKMIADGKTEIYLVLNDLALNHLREEIELACRRGIQVGVLLTGDGQLECDQVSYHPPAESELQGLEQMLVVVVDSRECLIANLNLDIKATITTNQNLVLISRQFVWMELFAQRINEHINPATLDMLDEPDRQILTSFKTRI